MSNPADAYVATVHLDGRELRVYGLYATGEEYRSLATMATRHAGVDQIDQLVLLNAGEGLFDLPTADDPVLIELLAEHRSATD
jgi:hypothetical protein